MHTLTALFPLQACCLSQKNWNKIFLIAYVHLIFHCSHGEYFLSRSLHIDETIKFIPELKDLKQRLDNKMSFIVVKDKIKTILVSATKF